MQPHRIAPSGVGNACMGFRQRSAVAAFTESFAHDIVHGPLRDDIEKLPGWQRAKTLLAQVSTEKESFFDRIKSTLRIQPNADLAKRFRMKPLEDPYSILSVPAIKEIEDDVAQGVGSASQSGGIETAPGGGPSGFSLKLVPPAKVSLLSKALRSLARAGQRLPGLNRLAALYIGLSHGGTASSATRSRLRAAGRGLRDLIGFETSPTVGYLRAIDGSFDLGTFLGQAPMRVCLLMDAFYRADDARLRKLCSEQVFQQLQEAIQLRKDAQLSVMSQVYWHSDATLLQCKLVDGVPTIIVICTLSQVYCVQDKLTGQIKYGSLTTGRDIPHLVALQPDRQLLEREKLVWRVSEVGLPTLDATANPVEQAEALMLQ